LSCCTDPVSTGSMVMPYSTALRENLGRSRSAVSWPRKTTPPLCRHWIDRLRLREVVPKSMTTSTWPWQASLVLSMRMRS
jgi:hypothetical protein